MYNLARAERAATYTVIVVSRQGRGFKRRISNEKELVAARRAPGTRDRTGEMKAEEQVCTVRQLSCIFN